MNAPDRRSVLLFEDDAVVRLGPIVHTRPAFEIRIGALCLRERLESLDGLVVDDAVVRPSLRPLLPSVVRGGGGAGVDTVLLVNARAVGPVEVLGSALTALGPDEGIEGARDGEWVAAHLRVDDVSSFLAGRTAPGTSRPCPARLSLVDRPWEIVPLNDRLLVADHGTLSARGAPVRRIFGVEFLEGSERGRPLSSRDFRTPVEDDFPGAILIEPDAVLVGEGVRIRPGAVIDAAEGPVILAAGVTIHPLSVVVGPAYLGPGTTVNPGAKLREGSSIGALCKVGGEVEETVMLDLSNKQHDGFLGHALVGSWVNLGADTNGSDLKNNYGTVRVDLGDGALDSGTSFVGQHLADHVKTGIDTMMTTGGVAGVAANLFGGGFLPRFVPAFTWGGTPDRSSTYRVEAALETARVVAGRREVAWDARHEELLRSVFEATRAQREAFGLDG